MKLIFRQSVDGFERQQLNKNNSNFFGGVNIFWGSKVSGVKNSVKSRMWGVKKCCGHIFWGC